MDIKEKILEILKQNPEELKHGQDTLKWILIINPGSDKIMQIAALGHDIEREVKSWNLGNNIPSEVNQKKFREEHSKRSAEIIKQLLEERHEKENFSGEEITKVYNLILNHEFGGDLSQNLLRDADSLANFEWCDDMFGRFPTEQLRGCAERMFSRMSEEKRRFIENIEFKNKEIKEMILNIKS